MSVCKKRIIRPAVSDRPLTGCQGHFNLFLLHPDASQLARQLILFHAPWTIPMCDCVCNVSFHGVCGEEGRTCLAPHADGWEAPHPTPTPTVLPHLSRKQPWHSQCAAKPSTHILFSCMPFICPLLSVCALLVTPWMCGGGGLLGYLTSSFLKCPQKPLGKSQVRDILDSAHQVSRKQFRKLKHTLEVSCFSKTKGGALLSRQTSGPRAKTKQNWNPEEEEETPGGAISPPRLPLNHWMLAFSHRWLWCALCRFRSYLPGSSQLSSVFLHTCSWLPQLRPPPHPGKVPD